MTAITVAFGVAYDAAHGVGRAFASAGLPVVTFGPSERVFCRRSDGTHAHYCGARWDTILATPRDAVEAYDERTGPEA